MGCFKEVIIKSLSVFRFLSVVIVVTIILSGCTGKQGERGPQGKDGIDGQTPTIEINKEGYWVINGEVTNYKATATDGKNGVNGKDGIDGQTPIIEINEEGYWVINGKVTNYKAIATDGKNGVNGKDGIDGQTPTIEINEEGYWVINGEVTNYKAVVTQEEFDLISAQFYLNALELSIVQAKIKGQNITDGQYNILENGNICISYENGKEECASELEVKVKGEIISKGTVTIKEGQIYEYSLVQNNKKR